MVDSNLLLVSFFLALIPDIPAASSNIFLRSIGFWRTKLPTVPWSIILEDLEPEEKSANKYCISFALTSLGPLMSKIIFFVLDEDDLIAKFFYI